MFLEFLKLPFVEAFGCALRPVTYVRYCDVAWCCEKLGFPVNRLSVYSLGVVLKLAVG